MIEKCFASKGTMDELKHDRCMLLFAMCVTMSKNACKKCKFRENLGSPVSWKGTIVNYLKKYGFSMHGAATRLVLQCREFIGRIENLFPTIFIGVGTF